MPLLPCSSWLGIFLHLLFPSCSEAIGLRRSSGRQSALRQPINVDYRLILANHDNVQYTGDFSIGSQALPVIYDTGSFEVIVLSTLCHSCTGHQVVYDSNKSASFVASQLQAQHEFGSGPVQSMMGFETVRMGDATSPLIATGIPFWQVVEHDIDVWNGDAHFSGIVGLGHTAKVPTGFGSDATKAEDTLLETMKVPSFSLCLQRGLGMPPGYLGVGPSVQASATPANGFHSLTVVGDVHWGVKMMNFELPGTGTESLCSPSCGAIIDSGTSLIAVPPSAASAVNTLSSLVPADCSNLQSLPVLRFQLDNSILELPPQAYIMKVTPAQQNSSLWDRIFARPAKSVEPVCVLAFMTIDKMSQFGPVWVLGMPFFRYYHTVFDRSAKKIHIKPSEVNCELPPVPPPQPAVQFMNATGRSNMSVSGASAAAASTSSKATVTRLAAASYSKEDFRPLEVKDLKALRRPLVVDGF